MLLQYDRYLIRSSAEEAKYGQTHRGQMSWAIGPRCCDDCHYFAADGHDAGVCDLFCRRTGRENVRFPGDAPACRFFEEWKPMTHRTK